MPNTNTEYTVNNDGQATIGMRIAIDFTGTVEKPTFTNATRGETVKVEKTFTAGDRIVIVTKRVTKTFILSGAVLVILMYI